MKIVAISDTHGRYRELEIPQDCDALVMAGDIEARNMKQLSEFLEWLDRQNARHKILVPGNNDFFFEVEPLLCRRLIEAKRIHLLINQELAIDGVTFWGSPVTPTFCAMAFNVDPSIIEDVWAEIPSETDVLITHGPPLGILDEVTPGKHCGCRSLKKRVLEVKPKVHIFGHIHEARGRLVRERTEFINAASFDYWANRILPAVELEIETRLPKDGT